MRTEIDKVKQNIDVQGESIGEPSLDVREVPKGDGRFLPFNLHETFNLYELASQIDNFLNMGFPASHS